MDPNERARRERFILAALQGYCAKPYATLEEIPKLAVRAADRTLALVDAEEESRERA